jgi:GntR family transcriptional regulator
MSEENRIPQPTVSQRLHEALRIKITNAQAGQRLPSEPELAQELGVSRATLREAMRTFETQGLIRRRQGSGTYVTHTTHIIESGLEILESIDTLAEQIGLEVHMGELSIETRSVTKEECDKLRLEPESLVLQVSRVIMAEDRPVAYLVDILPEEILPAERLDNAFTGSVLDILLKNFEPAPYLSRTEINADTASSEIAKLLGIQRGAVLLRFVADLYSANGRPIDHSISYFLPGYFRFHVVRRVG